MQLQDITVSLMPYLVSHSAQNIVMYEWLPTFLGINGENVTDGNCPCDDYPEPIPPYTVYKPHVHPGIVHAFQSAAMRFGHTMVPPGVWKR